MNYLIEGFLFYILIALIVRLYSGTLHWLDYLTFLGFGAFDPRIFITHLITYSFLCWIILYPAKLYFFGVWLA